MSLIRPLAFTLPLLLLSLSYAQEPTSQPATSTAPASQPAAINWDAAKDHVDKTATVTGPVISTHTSNDGKTLSLNVGKDFPDKDRFTVFLPLEKGADPDDTYKGKTISVTGKIILYRDIPEIKTTAKDITIQK